MFVSFYNKRHSVWFPTMYLWWPRYGEIVIVSDSLVTKDTRSSTQVTPPFHSESSPSPSSTSSVLSCCLLFQLRHYLSVFYLFHYSFLAISCLRLFHNVLSCLNSTSMTFYTFTRKQYYFPLSKRLFKILFCYWNIFGR